MELFIDFSFVAGIIINLIIIVMLYHRRTGEMHSNILLIIFWFFLLTVICFYSYFHQLAWPLVITYLANDVISVLIGSLIMLYVKSLFLPTRSLVRKNFIHFVFPIVYTFTFSIPLLTCTIQDDCIFP